MLEKITESFSNVFRSLSGKSAINAKNIEDAVGEIKLALLDADVNLRVVRRFVNQTIADATGEKVLKSVNPGQQFTKIVYDKLVALLGGNDEATLTLKNPDQLTVILMAGLQGSGKTTTAAKLALWLKNKKRRVLLAACDTVRPAAIEQLEQLGARIEVEVYSADKKDALKNAIQALDYAKNKQFDTLIIDTAGRLQVDVDMMAQLTSIKNKTKPDNTIFVVDSAMGQTAVDAAKAFNDDVGITGVIVTKLDGDARGGVALSIKSVTGRPILFSGTSEKVEGLEVFHPARVASRILGMGDVVSLVEKAQSKISDDEAAKLQEKAARNEYTLGDMLSQFQMMKSMGNVKDLIAMIPGFAGAEVDEKLLKKNEAIIQSMTKKERDNYLIIGPSRRKRIAKGSGVTVAQVNKLLKQFEKTRLAMKKVARNKSIQAKLMKQFGV